MVQYLQKIIGAVNVPPVNYVPRSSSTLRFVRSGVRITVDGEKILRMDDIGALFCLVVIPTCIGDVPTRPSPSCHRLARLLHALSHLTTRRKL